MAVIPLSFGVKILNNVAPRGPDRGSSGDDVISPEWARFEAASQSAKRKATSEIRFKSGQKWRGIQVDRKASSPREKRLKESNEIRQAKSQRDQNVRKFGDAGLAVVR